MEKEKIEIIDKMDNTVEYIQEVYQKNLCNKCPASIRGKCCYYSTRIIDNNLFYWKISLSKHPCKYLNTKTGRCRIYKKRHTINANCLTIKEMFLCGTIPKECLYVKNNPKYQKRKDTVLFKFPDYVSDYIKKKYEELNNSPHSKIAVYDTKRTHICPKCNSADLNEEWDDKFSVLFFKYKCNECGFKWNTLYEQVIWSYIRIKKVQERGVN